MIIEKRISQFILIAGFFLYFASVHITYAADLYISPKSAVESVGGIFSVSIFIDTGDQPMNAVSGAIIFPQDTIEVVSLSKTDSILNLWVKEPAFSNTAGTIDFEGIVLNPGFQGVEGKILTATLKAKRAGVASLNFITAAVLANDGNGTNIFENFEGASISITGSGNTFQESHTSFVVGAPRAPQVTSPTHPDPNKWYNNSSPLFRWNLEEGVLVVQTLVDENSNSIPVVSYTPIISEKRVEDMGDGDWYFHVRARNDKGWGRSSHFRFRIDTKQPTDFEITEIEKKNITDSTSLFEFSASDEMSGIDHYEVKIDDGQMATWSPSEDTNIYKTHPLSSGNHTLYMYAVDKAGNKLLNSKDFYVYPPNLIEITEVPTSAYSNEGFLIKGKTAFPRAKVVIWVEGQKSESQNMTANIFTAIPSFIKSLSESHLERHAHTVIADKNGDFSLRHPLILPRDSGEYAVWAGVHNPESERKFVSDPITVVILTSDNLLSEDGIIQLVLLVALIGIFGINLWFGRKNLAKLIGGIREYRVKK